MQSATYIVMAVHTQTLHLHNTSVVISVDDLIEVLELRLGRADFVVDHRGYMARTQRKGVH